MYTLPLKQYKTRIAYLILISANFKLNIVFWPGLDNSDHITNFFYNNIQLKSGDDHMLLYVIYIVLSKKISIILRKLTIYTSRFF